MKKLSVLFVSCVLMLGFFSCQKDNLGVFNPKMKINKVYSEADGHYLQEQWYWDGEQLHRIDFYRKNGDVNRTQRYFYENNMLSKIESGDEYTEFLYDGKLLTTINTYQKDQLMETYSLSYEKGKLSNMVVKKTTKEARNGSLLAWFLPGNGCEWDSRVVSHGEKSESYNFSSANMDFQWDGDNVKYVKMKIDRPDSVQKLTFSYVYDDKLNPLNRFLGLYLDHQLLNDAPQYCFCSKNNTVGVSVTDEYDVFSDTESFTYSYDYYKKWPTKVYSTFVNRETMNEDSVLLYSYIYL